MIIRNRSPKLHPLADWKFSDLLIRLGDVSPDRIRLHPWPSVTEWTQIGFTEALDGGDVLPDFKVTLKKLYELAFPERPKKKRGR